MARKMTISTNLMGTVTVSSIVVIMSKKDFNFEGPHILLKLFGCIFVFLQT